MGAFSESQTRGSALDKEWHMRLLLLLGLTAVEWETHQEEKKTFKL